MDFLNSDCAPDLMRLLKCKTDGKKNSSYYNFLKKIGEENIPLFSGEEIELVGLISDLLPLVRKDEYLIINEVLNDGNDFESLLGGKISRFTLDSAIKHLEKKNILVNKKLNVSDISNDLRLYLEDLIEYGLTRFDQEFGEFDGLFKPLRNYTKEQIMLLKEGNSYAYMLGTKFYSDGETIFFVGLNKNGKKKTEFDYKDEFLNGTTFQWESVKDTTFTKGDGPKLAKTKEVHLFIRKKDDEDGITLPFTYFGTGKLTNLRASNVSVKYKDWTSSIHDTVMYDVILDNKVPADYYFDFEIPEDKIDE